VAIRQAGVFDITENFPTGKPAARVQIPPPPCAPRRGERVGVLQDLLTNTPPDNRDPTKPWLLAPMICRSSRLLEFTFAVVDAGAVIEEARAATPDSAAAIRAGGDAVVAPGPFPIEAARPRRSM